MAWIKKNLQLLKGLKQGVGVCLSVLPFFLLFQSGIANGKEASLRVSKPVLDTHSHVRKCRRNLTSQCIIGLVEQQWRYLAGGERESGAVLLGNWYEEHGDRIKASQYYQQAMTVVDTLRQQPLTDLPLEPEDILDLISKSQNFSNQTYTRANGVQSIFLNLLGHDDEAMAKSWLHQQPLRLQQRLLRLTPIIFAQKGDTPKAVVSLGDIKGDKDYRLIEATTILALLYKGKINEAEQLLTSGRVEGPYKNGLLLELANLLAEAGKTKQALGILKKIDDPWLASEGQTQVGITSVDVGAWNKVGNKSSGNRNIDSLYWVIWKAADDGLINEALAYLAKLPPKLQDVDLVFHVAIELILFKKTDLAYQILKPWWPKLSLEDQRTRKAILLMLQGDARKALALFHQVQSVELKDWGWRTLTDIYLAHSDYTMVEYSIQRIRTPDVKVVVLEKVINKLLDTGKKIKSLQFIRQAMVLSLNRLSGPQRAEKLKTFMVLGAKAGYLPPTKAVLRLIRGPLRWDMLAQMALAGFKGTKKKQGFDYALSIKPAQLRLQTLEMMAGRLR